MTDEERYKAALVFMTKVCGRMQRKPDDMDFKRAVLKAAEAIPPFTKLRRDVVAAAIRAPVEGE